MEVIWNNQIEGIDMKLKIYDCLCATEVFVINGIVADSSDFGEKDDTMPWDAPEYGCGNMEFIPYEHPTDEVLKKYGITEYQFHEIAAELACSLSFGRCAWCA